MSAGALPVLNDPQFGLVSILRPYSGFDAQPGGAGTGSYQGVSGTTPIMFTEGGVALDMQAGQAGYSKRLLKGLSVPYGARIVVWLPSQFLLGGSSFYDWQFVWRMRNVFDYRTQRLAFHYPKQGLGAPDTTTAGDIGSRVVIPASSQVAVFQGTPSTTGLGQSVGQLAPDFAQPQSCPLVSPLIPPVAGIAAGVLRGLYNQGLVPPAFGASTFSPAFVPYELQALGDELLIGCIRDPTASPGTWDFTVAASDLLFSVLFGTGTFVGVTGPFPDIGVYVNAGVAT